MTVPAAGAGGPVRIPRVIPKLPDALVAHLLTYLDQEMMRPFACTTKRATSLIKKSEVYREVEKVSAFCRRLPKPFENLKRIVTTGTLEDYNKEVRAKSDEALALLPDDEVRALYRGLQRPLIPPQFKTILDVQDVYLGHMRSEQIMYELSRSLAAKRLFAMALDVTDVITSNPYLKCMALEAIAKCLAQSGRGDQALEMAKSMRSEAFKSGMLQTIAPYLTTDKQIKGALTCANTVVDAHLKSLALMAIARRLARMGSTEYGVEVANSIPNPYAKQETLREIRLLTTV